jgi:hypothetical protein
MNLNFGAECRLHETCMHCIVIVQIEMSCWNNFAIVEAALPPRTPRVESEKDRQDRSKLLKMAGANKAYRSRAFKIL